jgi:hypothetical chaperone protein
MEGRDQPFPQMLLAKLARWHHVAFLRAPKTREQLRRIRWTANEPAKIEAFEELVEANYAFFLFQEIERAKAALSSSERTAIRFRRHLIEIDEPLERAEFEALIAADLTRIDKRMHDVVRSAGLTPERIDSVFLTGGSAQIPAVRQLFAAAFGEEKLRAHDYLTSVAYGLGLSAAWR